MSESLIGCPLRGDLNIYIRGTEESEALDRLITVTEDHGLSEMLYEVYNRLFKGKFYSNSYNFATIVEVLGLTSLEYNTLLERLVNLEVLVEVKSRVYELGEKVYLSSGKETMKYIKK